jgi:acetyltransferase-like isoleucine patch superfamily enzyme
MTEQRLIDPARGIYHRVKSCLESDRFLPRCLQAVLFQISELESITLRPHERTFWRWMFLHLKGVNFTRPCYIGHGFNLYNTQQFTLQIGERCCIGERAGIYVHSDIEIGSDFLAAPGLTINNGSHDLASLRPKGENLRIGNRVWCGVNVTIVAGAEIGDDCVIGANSLVMTKIPSGSVAVGSPARVLHSNIRDSDAPDIWSPYGNSQYPDK